MITTKHHFKMKTYVLTVSNYFPKTHARVGESTGFVQNIVQLKSGESEKIHTIRGNYELWKKRAESINEGKAILSIRYWSGKPYQSKQVEICTLSSIGVQKLQDPTNFVYATVDSSTVNWEDLAKNDGLSFDDFCEWFKVRSKEPMAVIQFTDFKY